MKAAHHDLDLTQGSDRATYRLRVQSELANMGLAELRIQAALVSGHPPRYFQDRFAAIREIANKRMASMKR